jgi:hypothetical protein
MRLLVFVFLSMLLAVMNAGAQHPLVGTWEMISVRGVDADGKPFFLDTTSVRETKIITPTHYMLIAWDVEADSLIFNRAMAGQAFLDGNKYIEIPTQASVQIFQDVKADFSWKLDGDIFTQSGTIRRPDGKTVVLEALIFRRVKNVKPQPENAAIGTWNQLSASYTTSDGKTTSTFNAPDKRMLVVTPTHWMRIDHKNKKFDGVHYGTYSVQDGVIDARTTFSTHAAQIGAHETFTQKAEGNKLFTTATSTSPDGKPATYQDILEAVK